MESGKSWTGGIRRSLAAPPALAGIIHPWLAGGAFIAGGAYLIFVMIVIALGAAKAGVMLIVGMIVVVFGALAVGVALTASDPDWPTVMLMAARTLKGYRKGLRYVG